MLEAAQREQHFKLYILTDRTKKGWASFSPGNECVAASWVQRVDVTAGVVKYPVPEVFGKLEGYFPLSKRHLFTVPHVHLTAKVKDQHLLKDAKAEQLEAE